MMEPKESNPRTDSLSLEAQTSIPSDQQSDARIIREKNPPAVDGGLPAWLFLAASTMLEAIVWGYAFAFGIFQDYYSTHAPFQGSGNIAVIGTCAMGIAYLVSPLVIVVMILFPSIARWLSTAGVVVMCLSLALSSFSTNVTHLILSQGIGFGTGGCFAYTPSILFLSEWFFKRKGLAFGIVWAGSGLSGVIFPLAIRWLLDKYGIQAALRVSCVALFVLAAPFLYFHRPRLPMSETACQHRLDFRFLYNKVHIIYQLGNVAEALGYFLPAIYLPMYARSLGANELLSSLTVTLVNLASVFGCVLMGFLSDRYHVTTCILISTVGTVISVFFLWGFAVTIPPLYVFCITYGLTAGGFSSTWSSASHEIQRASPSADTAVIFAFMETGRGIGNVACGPLSEVLLKGDVWRGHAWGAYGSGYGTLVVCTGTTALVGGLCVVARHLKWV
ncbi:hypothetical protein NUU61_009519 [Penicillium alfredii]|uniref:Major facilitator superfamily (MFS) profile domain-containing protein n=1 Tax=Penicillium alfredii TaxID=1506179 RepID=A0A9W9ENG3_9EURO|nr:uncharacterized protein NUU61_009519 [Penicillium alfredii]KAJ5084940.1 hypothetical protein NUU61_009519 [Penicillium alfredii]